MQFIKYSSSGNDFLVFHTDVCDNGTRASLARRVCERHNGIGADGMVVLIPAKMWIMRMNGNFIMLMAQEPKCVGMQAEVWGITHTQRALLLEPIVF